MSSSDDSSDSDVKPKSGQKNVIAQAAASNKKKSIFSSSDEDDDLSSLDSDDSYFKPKKAPPKKAPPPKKTAPKKPEPAKPPPAVVEAKEKVEEKKEKEPEPEPEPVYEETTNDWLETIRLARKRRRRSALKGTRLRWAEEEIIICEFDPEGSIKSIKDPEHVDEDYDQVPWDEQEYEELPWWEQPDIDEDDALTALCKKVMEAGDTEMDRKKAEAVESRVINFALKLKNKSLFRKKSPFKKTSAQEQKQEAEPAKAKETSAGGETGGDNKQEVNGKANPVTATGSETGGDDKQEVNEKANNETNGEDITPSQFSGDLQTCLDALSSAKGGDSMTLQLPCDLSDVSRELMSNMVNKLQSDSTALKNVSVVIPSDVSEDFILSGGIESLLATISDLKDLEEFSIESSNEVAPPILPTSFISQALKRAAENEESRLTAVSVRKLRLSNSKDHMSELTEALCTLNMLPSLKSTKVSVEFLA